jgi:hypothetical protein
MKLQDSIEAGKPTKTGMVGWAGGIFEGEGCVSMRLSSSRNQNKRYPGMSVVSSDLDILEKFMEIVDCGTIHTRKSKNKLGKKKIWVWQIGSRRDVSKVVKMLWPYLGERRKKAAQIAMESYEGEKQL